MRTVHYLRLRRFGASRMACIVSIFCVAAAIASSAQTFTTLVNFDYTNGAYSTASLIQGTDGNLYGTTSGGGSGNCQGGCGTFFKMTPGGTLTTLHSFAPPDPSGPSYLVQGSDGNFYGIAGEAIFKITPEGTVTTLYTFTDYDFPNGLVQATDGNFYGTTHDMNDPGTVFKITPGGTLTTLYRFEGYTYGGNPVAGLVQGTDGNFYGTTESGGLGYACGGGGCGTVFNMTPGGTLTTLHSFELTDGDQPRAALLQGTDGNFYGTTFAYGAHDSGTVFKITPEGTLTTLASFDYTDGTESRTAVIQATDGNFYGTTPYGGIGNCQIGCGVLFKVTPGGALTALHSFDGADGLLPSAALAQGTDGSFYGTTYEGGPQSSNCPAGCGTIFKLSVGLGPFVATEPTSGGVGAPVVILGTNLTGSTGVTFNGTHANFSVVSPSEITTNVPAGATSGTVRVTTSSGTLSSNVMFRVTYALTVSVSGNGNVASTDGLINCPGTCSNSYPGNTRVTLNAAPALGWAFSGWSGACSGNGSCVVTMTENLSVSARFTQLSYTLTVSTVGSGTVASTDGLIDCPGTCSHTYLSLTPVTLNASPASGWMFSGWTGPCNGVGPCTFAMTQNLEATAVFIEPGHGLQFIAAKPCRLVDTRTDHDPIQGGNV